MSHLIYLPRKIGQESLTDSKRIGIEFKVGVYIMQAVFRIRIRDIFRPWIRIRIRDFFPDPDPRGVKKELKFGINI